jgi:hypothetical protein
MNCLLREGTQKDWQHFGGLVSEKWPKRRRHSKHACVICFCFFFPLLVNFVLPRPFSHPSFFSFILSFFVPTFLPCLTERSNKNGKYLYYVKLLVLGLLPSVLRLCDRRFGTPCLFHLLGGPRRRNPQGVPKRRSKNITRWAITHKLEVVIQPTAKAWNSRLHQMCFMIFPHHQILPEQHSKDEETDGECGTYGGGKIRISFAWETSNDHLQVLRVSGRIILKWTLNKYSDSGLGHCTAPREKFQQSLVCLRTYISQEGFHFYFLICFHPSSLRLLR